MSTVAIPEQEATTGSPRKRQKMETQVEIVDLEAYDDGGFFLTSISNRGTNKKDPISVEQYSENRELHIAIMASLNVKKKIFVDLSTEYNDGVLDDDLKVLDFKPQSSPFGKRKKPFSGRSVTEAGQSSNSRNDDEKDDNSGDQSFVCEICVESKSLNESFGIKGCSHSYCTDCMSKYVASKLQENITNIPCPVADCRGLLEPEYCRPILPPEVFDRWGNALCEGVILASQKFYCPFKDCSALLIDDGGQAVMQSECPNCWRLFCAQCKVPWHTGIECTEFQMMKKDEREREDIMLMKLAKDKNWKRCPTCGYYVEKTQGCMYMRCRCGMAFCYSCGTISQDHTYHNCKNCGR